MKIVFTKRDKAIIIGLFFSKFNNDALSAFGFDNFTQAFNVLGTSIDCKPNSVKNYRDEFDPYFPNNTMGRHNRSIRPYCEKILNNFGELAFFEFVELVKSFVVLVKSFVVKDYQLQKFIDEIEEKQQSETFAKRLITGEAAEEYFKYNYNRISSFKDLEISDTTKLGCGFDFKLSLDSQYFCVEVKGINESHGSILMTEKEFYVAQKLKERYCLYVVSNFVKQPTVHHLFDPLNSNLKFKKTERSITQVSFLTSI